MKEPKAKKIRLSKKNVLNILNPKRHKNHIHSTPVKIIQDGRKS